MSLQSWLEKLSYGIRMTDSLIAVVIFAIWGYRMWFWMSRVISSPWLRHVLRFYLCGCLLCWLTSVVSVFWADKAWTREWAKDQELHCFLIAFYAYLAVAFYKTGLLEVFGKFYAVAAIILLLILAVFLKFFGSFRAISKPEIVTTLFPSLSLLYIIKSSVLSGCTGLVQRYFMCCCGLVSFLSFFAMCMSYFVKKSPASTVDPKMTGQVSGDVELSNPPSDWPQPSPLDSPQKLSLLITSKSLFDHNHHSNSADGDS